MDASPNYGKREIHQGRDPSWVMILVRRVGTKKIRQEAWIGCHVKCFRRTTASHSRKRMIMPKKQSAQLGPVQSNGRQTSRPGPVRGLRQAQVLSRQEFWSRLLLTCYIPTFLFVVLEIGEDQSLNFISHGHQGDKCHEPMEVVAPYILDHFSGSPAIGQTSGSRKPNSQPAARRRADKGWQSRTFHGQERQDQGMEADHPR